jgi:hypothetical protein
MLAAQKAHGKQYRASLICEEESRIKGVTSNLAELKPCAATKVEPRCKVYRSHKFTTKTGYQSYWDYFVHAWTWLIRCEPGKTAGICIKNPSDSKWVRVMSCNDDGPEAVITVVYEGDSRRLRGLESDENIEVVFDEDDKTFVIIPEEDNEDETFVIIDSPEDLEALEDLGDHED